MFRAACLAALAWAAAAQAAEPLVHDPMQPPQHVDAASGGVRPGPPTYRLTAVLISPSRRVAVVNGKPYTRGQIVDDAEVASIEADAVQLKRGKKVWAIHLGASQAPSVGEGDSGS